MTISSQRAVCIHGHFYQPPREDPWLGAVQVQESAYPYHDWDQRVTAECYAPNAWAHLMDSQGRVARLVNNYARISFDVGPTLLVWLERHAPEVYQAVLEADRESMGRYGGHGSAMAQPYHHMIMPLAHMRDKRTQVLWGLEDFRRRFHRRAEGMWLPETAVDLATLEVMAEQGVAFTLLEPRQVTAVWPIAGGAWTQVLGGQVDTTRPYLVRLPSRRSINVFFYNGPLSRSVAFEGLLRSGDDLARALAGAFHQGDGPQLAHIATDGESYGHHHRFGDMALAYALDMLESRPVGTVRLTNYGQYLEQHPPEWEALLAERTSWSCNHGVERWRNDCGCNTGASPGWNQQWRRPLREAMDWLRDALALRYEGAATPLFHDPWAARDAFVSIVLDRSAENLDAFFAQHAAHRLGKEQRVTALKLLEMQRNAMSMFTSCGWFFDEPSRIETVQVLRYAARAIHMAQELFGDSLEPAFLDMLAQAKSNLPEQGDCRRIYERQVLPCVQDWDSIAAHHAVALLYPDVAPTSYSFTVQGHDLHRREEGRSKALAGTLALRSVVTGEEALRTFLVWDGGGLRVQGRVGALPPVSARGLTQRFEAGAPLEELLAGLHGAPCSLESLFEDERQAVEAQAMDDLLLQAESVFWRSYDHRAEALAALSGLHVPLPRDVQANAEFFLNRAFLRAARDPNVTAETLRGLAAKARTVGARLVDDAPGYELGRTLAQGIAALPASPSDLSLLQRLKALAWVAKDLPFQTHVAEAQNKLWLFLRSEVGQAALVPGSQGKEALLSLAEALWVAPA